MIGSLTPERVQTQEAVVDTLTLSGVSTQHIAEDIDTEQDDKALLTVKSLKTKLEYMSDTLEALDPNGTFFRDISCISQSLTEQYFNELSDWELNSWAIVDNRLITYGGNDNNSVTINRVLYPSVGNYFLFMEVEHLPSGKLELYKNDEWIGTIEKSGTYYREFTVDSPTNDDITLKAIGVAKNEKVALKSYAVYFLAGRFYTYVLEKVKSLATVDATSFVTIENFNKSLEVFATQFNAVTNQYLERLNAHKKAVNPHKITVELIGAAPAEHTHKQYLTEAMVEDLVDKALADYAPIDHTHEQYVTVDQIDTMVEERITERISELVSVDPLVISKAPTGILPSRFAQNDVSLPVALLIPTTVQHTPESSYDWYAGMITTNRGELMTEAPKAFSDTFATIGADVSLENPPINFRIFYHTSRTVTGYRIHSKGTKPVEWSVVSGNTTFLHRVVDPQNYVTTEDDYQCEIYFDADVTADSLSFIFDRIESEDPVEWQLWIELLYVDYKEETSFGISNEELQFSVPQDGTNRVITVPAAMQPRVITPEVVVPYLSLYVFVRKNFDDATPFFDISYIPPEYANACRGLDVLANRTEQFEKDRTASGETFVHPAYGTLSLTSGHSGMNDDLLEIYRNSDTSWHSDGQTDQITIEQTFDSDNVILKGYQLNWKNNDVSTIPDTWTLTVTGVDKNGSTLTTVFDSVDQYYPFYSVEDDDIVYHASFDIEMTVKKIVLTMGTKRTANPAMSINQLGFFICERFYSVPQNVMYLGLKPTSSICIGRAIYQPGVGWGVVNSCIGTACVIPVNNLDITNPPFAQYSIPNPFLSEDVTASIHSYELMPSDVQRSPMATITAIKRTEILITAETPARFAVVLSRNW